MEHVKTLQPRRRAVLVVTPYYADHGGSMERIAGRLIDTIKATDQFHFTWMASHCTAPKDCTKSSPSTAPIEDKGLMVLPMPALNHMERFLGLRWPIWQRRNLRRLQRAVEGVDCVWLHETLSLGSLLAFRMARQQNKPVLITKHSGHAPSPNLLERGWSYLLDQCVTKTILRQASQTTFTGDGSAHFYYQRVDFSAPVKIIPNGVDSRIFHPCNPEERQKLRARYALRRNQPVLLFVGRFTKDTGLPMLRHLAQLLPDWRFWVAGEGAINPEKWFLPNMQIFRGRRDEDLAELYRAADLLIQPGYRQSFPLAAQEAMACGLPMMCSPAIAACSDFAKPYLWVVDVDPAHPDRTAALWAKKLQAGRSLLPLKAAKAELAELAENFWQWPRIGAHYADTLISLCKKSA